MRIKDFCIDNLYYEYAFSASLDEHVNIIVGNNGTFKTTLLRLLRHAIAYEKNGQFFQSRLTKVTFKDDMVMEYHETENLLSKDKDGEDILKNVTSWTPMLNGNKVSESDYHKLLKLDFVSTFDVKGDGKSSQDSYLDTRLEKLQSDYGYYLSDLVKELTERINLNSSITKSELDKINERKNLFISLVNECFAETGKTLSNDSTKLVFLKDNAIGIYPKELSSGEKQLLIILLTVLLERGEEYILMLDEPEISMHISWQYKLIDMILQLNPNVQIILTTHSPMIFSDGWGDKAIHMEDITINTRK
ncbi:MAG: ATP-binding protein [Bacteroidaceae bacterium]|nr:ATP-binding protein [Bacteroidaceae bacterium]